MLLLSGLHTPAVIRLILHAGDKGDDVLRAVVQDAGIVHADLIDRIYLIAAGAELGGQLDGVPNVKGVNFAKVIIHATVVTGDGHIALPDGGAGKMARALAKRVSIRPLIHLDRQAEGGDFQCTEVGRPNTPASGPSK